MISYTTHAQYVFYYVFTSLSILGNLLVLYSLWGIKKSKTCFTFLLYYLHTSILCISILSFPYAYKGSSVVCEGIEGLECYFALMCLCTVALMVEAHRSNILESQFDVKRLIHKYGSFFLIGFPLIVFLGYGTGGYEQSHDAFCLVQTNFHQTSFLTLYLLWVWIILIYCTIRIINTLYRISLVDKLLATRFFTSIGLYIVVTLISWIPRTLVRFFQDPSEHDDDNQYTNSLFLIGLFPIQIGGILYSFIYFKEKTSIKLFERNRSSINADGKESDEGFSFSWDEVITPDLLARTTSVNTIVERKSQSTWSIFAKPVRPISQLLPAITGPSIQIRHASQRILLGSSSPLSPSPTQPNPLHR